MSETDRPTDGRPEAPAATPLQQALRAARGPLLLTWAGLWVERVGAAFWPVWTLLFFAIAALAFGAGGLMGDAWLTLAGLVVLAALVVFLVLGALRFRFPRRAEALARLDAGLANRPFAALADAQAVGASDAQSGAVWRAHLARMAERARAARAVPPRLRLSGRDPLGLRHLAVGAFALAMIFGQPGRLIGIEPALPGAGPAVAAGPAWEGWIQPPAYTGKPALYLNDIDRAGFSVPQGAQVTLRLYGAAGGAAGAERLSQTLGPAAKGPDASGMVTFMAEHSGRLAIDGVGGRGWQIEVIPDLPPTAAFKGIARRRAGGEMRQDFTAHDDYGVIKGHVTITLDLAAVDRRYGLKVAPEPRAPLVFDLPMPITGDRTDFTGTIVENLAQNPWANLPVKMVLTVEDAAGHIGHSAPQVIDLPGRRFFDPLAAAVIEMRRDLLWSRANGPRTVEILNAITNRPEGFIKNEGAYLLLRLATKRLQFGIEQGLSPEARDDVAAALWEAAVEIEDGTLANALERLRQAQDRLSEAIRRGASPDEVQKLMDEFNEAMRNYVARLAEQQKSQPDQQQADNQNSMTITGDQMQQLMQRLQKLMNEGRTAEAQALLDQLSKMMENMRVTEGKGGMQIPGQGAMKDLSDTLKKQQELSDRAFQDMQKRPQGQEPGQQQGQKQGQQQAQQQGQQPGGQGPQGQKQGEQGQQQGQQGAAPGGSVDRQALADQQKRLREALRRQSREGLPGGGTPDGQQGREALKRAGRAMEGAEQALRKGDLPGALDKQAEAMDALREGIGKLNRGMAQNQAPDQGQQGSRGQQAQQGSRDPLGRDAGTVGRMGTNQNLLGGEDIYRRAEEILKELRKRSGELSRPEAERDYLKRLLEPF